MFGEQQIRTLLGPADPARPGAVAPPRLSAHDLIVLAEAAPEPVDTRLPARPTRRLVLAAGAAVALAAAGTVVYTSRDEPLEVPNAMGRPGANPAGPVLVPIAYQFPEGTRPAAAELLALAGRLRDAPYENSVGRYAYHSSRMWGIPMMMATAGGPPRSGGPYVIGPAYELKTWQAADGTGRQIRTFFDPEFPDEASRDSWTNNPRPSKEFPSSSSEVLPPAIIRPLPSDRAGLSDLLRVGHGAGWASLETTRVYERYVVPRGTRAEILRVLADVPGFVWRGEVTDRAGRAGLAITFDDRASGQQHLLVFNPTTGELAAHEVLTLEPLLRISTYAMILDTGRTHTTG